jgi:hypothetical protein
MALGEQWITGKLGHAISNRNYNRHFVQWLLLLLLLLLLLSLLLYYVRFEVFTAVTMKNGVFWDVTLCGSCKNRRFGGTQRLLHQVDKNQ